MPQDRDGPTFELPRAHTSFAACRVRLGAQHSSRQGKPHDGSQEPSATRARVTDEAVRRGDAARALLEEDRGSSSEGELQCLERQARIAEELRDQGARRAEGERREAARASRYEDRSAYLRYARYVWLAVLVVATFRITQLEAIVSDFVRLLH
jgi:hypothetical protein